MATLAENTPNEIRFVNADGSKNNPTLCIQAGDWDVGDHIENGIVFDTFGDQAPILSAADARKLAKWLTRAADIVDGGKQTEKKNKTRHRYENEDDDDDPHNYKW